MSSPSSWSHKFTEKQGQYLAFIHSYTLMNRRAPAEADMEKFFGVTPPSVHRMVIELEKRGLIERTPGQARSIALLVPSAEIPTLSPQPIKTTVGRY
jgi:DNA-binding MarR family transcriptional regulator